MHPVIRRPLFRAVLGLLAAGGALAPSLDGASAQGVVNGDFSSGFSGWSLDTDGALGDAPDFTIGGSGNPTGRITADYFDTPGDLTSAPANEVFLANTLHQAIDTTTAPLDTLVLSFDWTFGGEDGAASGGETFLVGLGDGSGALYGPDGLPGHLLAPTSSYGSGTVVVFLDPAAFNNVSGWTLDFQLVVGVDPVGYAPNALGSFVEIDDVALPEPDGAAAIALGAGLLLLLARGGGSRRIREGHLAAEKSMRSAMLLGVSLVLAAAPPSEAAAGWTEVTASVQLTQTRPEFDRIDPALAGYVTVTNTSGGPLDGLLRLVLDASLPVSNPDGYTGSHAPYIAIPALAEMESTTVRVRFERVRAPLSYSATLEQLEPDTLPLAIVTPPTLVMDPNGLTPLAGRITAETSIPARATLTVSGAGEAFTVEFSELQTQHSLPVLGLKPATSYSIDVEFFDQQDDSISGGSSLNTTTPPLPADFPAVTVFTSQPSLMEPGFTLVDRFSQNSLGERYATIFDASGEVVWLGTFGGLDMELSGTSGRLNLGPGPLADERDMLGGVVSSLALDTTMTLHHDLFRTAYGTFLSLGRMDVIETSYPTSETDPEAPTAEATLLDEPPVEFLPNGQLLNLWPLSGLIDTTRIAYDSLATGAGGALDWVHANAVFHDTRDDSLLVSLRHQDAVLKISRYTGKLLWILGPHDNWKPSHQPFLLTPVGAPFEWQFHQHAIETTPSGHFLLFDNGNHRASPFDGNTPLTEEQTYSRAVEYAVDEETLEVSQVWEWGGDVPDPLYSSFICDADSQPQTGNVLIHFGGHSHYANQTIASQGWGGRAIRVVEVTHDTPAQKVFDLLIYVPGPNTERVFAYRAERIPSLYPANVTVTQLP